MKRILSYIFTGCFSFFLISLVAVADDALTLDDIKNQLADSSYAKVVYAGGGTIDLDDDLTLTKPISFVDNETTLNLNDYAINMNYGGYSDYSIKVGAKLSISGNGTVNANAGYGIAVFPEASAPSAELVINGGTYNASSSNYYIISTWNTTTINGGTFNGQYSVVNNFSPDKTLTINDGTFTTVEDDGITIAAGGLVVINGGTFDATGTDAYELYNDGSSFTINGGNYGHDVYNNVAANPIDVGTDKTLYYNISDGRYYVDNVSTLPAGEKTIELNNTEEAFTIDSVGKKYFELTSSDDTVASLDADFKATALKEGENIITIDSHDVINKTTSTFKITVVPQTLTEIIPENNNVTLLEGEKTQINVTPNPSTIVTNYTYESNDKNVAKVSDTGEIEAITEGNAVITIRSTYDSNVYTTINVTVKKDNVIPEDKTVDESDLSPSTSTGKKNPKTFDNISLYFAMMGLSFVGELIFIKNRKKIKA